MSVTYVNEFGRKRYQPEVDGRRLWEYPTKDWGEWRYVWSEKRFTARAEPVLCRTRPGAWLHEHRERREQMRDRRNVWKESTDD